MNLAQLTFDSILEASRDSRLWFRELWSQFDPFFAANGLALWVARPEEKSQSIPPDTRPRAPDGFSYHYQGNIDRLRVFPHGTSLLHPARTRDGRDVVIRIVSIGDDGGNHVQALQRLATGHVASVIGNHAIPVLQWLEFETIKFAVFPMLSTIDPTLNYRYKDTQDLLNHVHQMFEAVEFCHSKLVAHRDVFPQNFLGNYVDAAFFRSLPAANEGVQPFRSLFPFTLYLIDFESAVCFDEGSDRTTHLVSGMPTFAGSGGSYTRPVAPELLLQEPYNPFLTDVWQLGTYLADVSKQHKFPDAAQALIDWMHTDTSSERPSAKTALHALDGILDTLTLDELRAPAWIRPEPRAQES